MTAYHANESLMSGNWQFHHSITEERVVELAQGFANGLDGERYLDLHVRGGADESFVLGFKYALSSTTQKAWDNHFHKMRQIIIDRIGDKKLVVWSIATPTVVIKQVAL